MNTKVIVEYAQVKMEHGYQTHFMVLHVIDTEGRTMHIKIYP
jgi:hypothetical protein